MQLITFFYTKAKETKTRYSIDKKFSLRQTKNWENELIFFRERGSLVFLKKYEFHTMKSQLGTLKNCGNGAISRSLRLH